VINILLRISNKV